MQVNVVSAIQALIQLPATTACGALTTASEVLWTGRYIFLSFTEVVGRAAPNVDVAAGLCRIGATNSVGAASCPGVAQMEKTVSD